MRFLFKIVGIMVFCGVSFYALFLAYGYQYDVLRHDIKKTSIIDLATRENNVEVTFNGKLAYRGNLPYQFKNVAPGTAEFLLKKKDFLPWKRTLDVKEDFVSKITDILFVPENISSWKKELASFVDDITWVAGDEFLILFKNNKNYFTVIFFNSDGAFRQKEIVLHHENLKFIEILPNRSVLVHFDDGAVEFILLDEEKYVVFSLPEKAFNNSSHVTVSLFGDAVYYILDGVLYRFVFPQFNQNMVIPVFGEKIRSDVTSFAVTEKRIYYISSGMLFSSDFAGKELALLDKNFGHFSNIQSRKGHKYSFLIGVNGDDYMIFSLYLENSDYTLKYVGDTAGGPYLFNNLDYVIFPELRSDQLFLYDPGMDKTIPLRRDDYFDPHDLIGWFDDEHFLFQEKDRLFVSDISMSNISPLLENINLCADLAFFAKNRVLFYYCDKKLNVLNWQK